MSLISRMRLGRALRRGPETGRPRAQIAVIFALSIFVFVGLCALAIDVSWYWANGLRMQRAADAAALAGVVHLPGDETTAVSVARAESAKNGYTNGTGGVTVAAQQDPTNSRRLQVQIQGSVGTFFARVFGITSWNLERRAKAEFVLPVPMGSPENYYGVFGAVRTPSGGTWSSNATAWFVPTATPSGTSWVTPGNAYLSDDAYATYTSTTNPYQAYGTFGISVPAGETIRGIEVELESKSTDTSGCRFGVELSWAAGTVSSGSNWTSSGNDVSLTGVDTDLVAGSPTDTWGRTWTSAELSDANFRIRVAYEDPGTNCTNGSTHSLDRLRVRIYTGTFSADTNLTGPDGSSLNPRGFWATMINQGAEDINGDAYLAQYATRTSSTNTDYQPSNYYNYAVEIPVGASAGQVWIYDPVFCGTSSSGQYGTGDRWFSGTNAVSAFYTLYNTNNTPYDSGDDTSVASSGTLFSNVQASDTTLNGPSGVSSCAVGDVTDPTDGRYWHNRWWQLGSGLAAGTYRIHTTSTDLANPTAQANANGHNSFAVWTTATGGTPRVYGIGAMEAFSPLASGSNATFYLAQIDAAHAGKTVTIGLWDPGDTGSLSANLEILIPTTTGYQAATMSWTAAKGTTHASASSCNSSTGTNVTSITTNTGGSSQFNGCWITINIPIPSTYTAPQPPGENESGWWKIRYNMGSQSASPAFDLTTWQVSIRGNPVHLILP